MLTEGMLLHQRYLVTRTLGRGGLSIVYEVQDQQLPRRLACKAFRPPSNLSPDELAGVRAQFSQEIALLSRLSHPRLPAVVDSFTEGETDFMVMELVRGETLDQLIRGRTEPFDSATVRTWALQILEILDYLHGQPSPIIYRDIKPQNIIIDPERGVRFIDFGIARLFNPVKDQDTIFMGTPGFAPPEQFRQRQTDPRSDLFSLGATLHYLLTLSDPGQHPFSFEPVSLHHPGVDPVLEKAIARAVEIRPENRLQTAKDFARVLRGEVAIEDLLHPAVVLVEPREVQFEDVPWKGRPERTVRVRGVSTRAGGNLASVVDGRLTSEHDGLEVVPSQIAGADTTVVLRLRPERFPRGETVQTAVVLSTSSSKIQVPVTVRFRPNLLQGLHPAAASLVLFAIPVVTALGWGAAVAGTEPVEPRLTWAVIALAALLAGAAIPAELLSWAALPLFAILCAAVQVPAQMVLREGGPGMALLPAASQDITWLVSLHLVCGGLLLLYAWGLSARQRAEMKPVILASFYLFGVVCFLLSLYCPRAESLVQTRPAPFFACGLPLDTFFLLAFLLGSARQQARLLEGRDPAGRARLWRRTLAPLALGAVVTASFVPFQDALAAATRQSQAAFRLQMTTDPIRALASTANADSKLVQMVHQLSRGKNESSRGSYPVRLYDMCLRQARQVESTSPREIARLQFLLYQCWLQSGQHLQHAGGGGSYYQVPSLPPAGAALSRTSLDYYRPSTEGLFVPTPFFYYLSEGKPVVFKTDEEVALAFAAQHAVQAELDRPRTVDLALWNGIALRLPGRGESPVADALRAEIALRRPLERSSGPQALAAIGKYYLGHHQPGLAARYYARADFARQASLDDQAALLLAMSGQLSMYFDSFYNALSQSSAHRPVLDALSAFVKARGQGQNSQALETLQQFAATWAPPPGERSLWERPWFVRLYRDACALVQAHEAARQASERLARLVGAGALQADDHYRWAWCLEMLGRFEEARPHYEAFVARGGAENAQRLQVVRNRLDGGPLPSIIYGQQTHAEHFRLVVVGQGVPAEAMPEVLAYWDPDKPYTLRTSDNISLEPTGKFGAQRFHCQLYRVRFKNPEEEVRQKTWRFWYTCDSPPPLFYPGRLRDMQMVVFNDVYAKLIPPKAVGRRALPAIPRNGDGYVTFADRVYFVLPRFRFEPPLPRGDIQGAFNRLTSPGERELSPDELLRAFTPGGARPLPGTKPDVPSFIPRRPHPSAEKE